MVRLDPAAGRPSRSRAACADRLDRRGLRPVCRGDRGRRGARRSGGPCRRMDRLAPALSPRGDQFLVPERAGGPAWLCVLARGAQAPDRAIARSQERRGLARIRSLSCAGAGILLFAVAGLVAFAAWPQTRWIGSVADLASPRLLIFPTIANTVVIMSSYLAVASLVWGFADAGVDQPLDLEAFDAAPAGRARLAGRASLRCSCRRRTLRVSHRKRARRSARQRSARTGFCPACRLARQTAA